MSEFYVAIGNSDYGCRRIEVFESEDRMKGFIDGWEDCSNYVPCDYYPVSEEFARDEEIKWALDGIAKAKENA